MTLIYGDYHTHTRYSDGLGTIRDNVEAARAAGLSDIGISDHGFNNYALSLNRKKSIRQKKEIQALRQEFKDIRILHSIEADIIGLDGSLDMTITDMHFFDYIIAGFHPWAMPVSFRDYRKFYISAYLTTFRSARAEEIIRNTDATIKMLEKYPVAVLAHMNNLTIIDCKAVAEVCAELGILVELNAKHLIRNLGRDNMEKLLTTQVKFIINSDAHKPSKVGKVDSVLEFLSPYGLDNKRVVNLGKETPEFRTYKNWNNYYQYKIL